MIFGSYCDLNLSNFGAIRSLGFDQSDIDNFWTLTLSSKRLGVG